MTRLSVVGTLLTIDASRLIKNAERSDIHNSVRLRRIKRHLMKFHLRD